MKSFFALLLTIVFSTTNVLFATLPESVLWKERAASLPRMMGGKFPSSKTTPHSRHSSLALSSFGTVRKVLHPANKPLRQIIHIQDVHLNIEAQKNISNAIRHLIDDNGASLLALEGAFAPMDLSAFRMFPSDIDRKITDFLLRENKIPGALHGAILAAKPLPTIVGVDHAEAYQANVDAYLSSLPLKAALRLEQDRALTALGQNKAAVFNADLDAFDKKIISRHAGKMEFGAYARLIGETAGPHVRNFLSALKMEHEMDLVRVERERADALDHLVARLSPKQINDFRAKSFSYRTGVISAGVFYASMLDLFKQHHLPSRRFPAFLHYISYLNVLEKIDGGELLRELERGEKARYASLAKTDAERVLIEKSRRLYLVGKLLDFSLTKEEWTEFWAIGGDFPAITPFMDFYRQAERRDQAIANNFISAAPASPSPAILVTGGFHASGIDQRLVNAGYEVVQFVPKLSKVNGHDGSEYLTEFSRQKTPLEELFEGKKLFLAKRVLPFADRVFAAVAYTSASRLQRPVSPLSASFDAMAGGVGVEFRISDVDPSKREVRGTVSVPDGEAVKVVFQDGVAEEIKLTSARSEWPGASAWNEFAEQIFFLFPQIILILCWVYLPAFSNSLPQFFLGVIILTGLAAIFSWCVFMLLHQLTIMKENWLFFFDNNVVLQLIDDKKMKPGEWLKWSTLASYVETTTAKERQDDYARYLTRRFLILTGITIVPTLLALIFAPLQGALLWGVASNVWAIATHQANNIWFRWKGVVGAGDIGPIPADATGPPPSGTRLTNKSLLQWLRSLTITEKGRNIIWASVYSTKKGDLVFFIGDMLDAELNGAVISPNKIEQRFGLKPQNLRVPFDFPPGYLRTGIIYGDFSVVMDPNGEVKAVYFGDLPAEKKLVPGEVLHKGRGLEIKGIGFPRRPTKTIRWISRGPLKNTSVVKFSIRTHAKHQGWLDDYLLHEAEFLEAIKRLRPGEKVRSLPFGKAPDYVVCKRKDGKYQVATSYVPAWMSIAANVPAHGFYLGLPSQIVSDSAAGAAEDFYLDEVGGITYSGAEHARRMQSIGYQHGIPFGTISFNAVRWDGDRAQEWRILIDNPERLFDLDEFSFSNHYSGIADPVSFAKIMGERLRSMLLGKQVLYSNLVFKDMNRNGALFDAGEMSLVDEIAPEMLDKKIHNTFMAFTLGALKLAYARGQGKYAGLIAEKYLEGLFGAEHLADVHGLVILLSGIVQELEQLIKDGAKNELGVSPATVWAVKVTNDADIASKAIRFAWERYHGVFSKSFETEINEKPGPPPFFNLTSHSTVARYWTRSDVVAIHKNLGDLDLDRKAREYIAVTYAPEDRDEIVGSLFKPWFVFTQHDNKVNGVDWWSQTKTITVRLLGQALIAAPFWSVITLFVVGFFHAARESIAFSQSFQIIIYLISAAALLYHLVPQTIRLNIRLHRWWNKTFSKASLTSVFSGDGFDGFFVELQVRHLKFLKDKDQASLKALVQHIERHRAEFAGALQDKFKKKQAVSLLIKLYREQVADWHSRRSILSVLAMFDNSKAAAFLIEELEITMTSNGHPIAESAEAAYPIFAEAIRHMVRSFPDLRTDRLLIERTAYLTEIWRKAPSESTRHQAQELVNRYTDFFEVFGALPPVPDISRQNSAGPQPNPDAAEFAAFEATYLGSPNKSAVPTRRWFNRVLTAAMLNAELVATLRREFQKDASSPDAAFDAVRRVYLKQESSLTLELRPRFRMAIFRLWRDAQRVAKIRTTLVAAGAPSDSPSFMVLPRDQTSVPAVFDLLADMLGFRPIGAIIVEFTPVSFHITLRHPDYLRFVKRIFPGFLNETELLTAEEAAMFPPNETAGIYLPDLPLNIDGERVVGLATFGSHMASPAIHAHEWAHLFYDQSALDASVRQTYFHRPDQSIITGINKVEKNLINARLIDPDIHKSLYHALYLLLRGFQNELRSRFAEHRLDRIPVGSEFSNWFADYSRIFKVVLENYFPKAYASGKGGMVEKELFDLLRPIVERIARELNQIRMEFEAKPLGEIKFSSAELVVSLTGLVGPFTRPRLFSLFKNWFMLPASMIQAEEKPASETLLTSRSTKEKYWDHRDVVAIHQNLEDPKLNKKALAHIAVKYAPEDRDEIIGSLFKPWFVFELHDNKVNGADWWSQTKTIVMRLIGQALIAVPFWSVIALFVVGFFYAARESIASSQSVQIVYYLISAVALLYSIIPQTIRLNIRLHRWFNRRFSKNPLTNDAHSTPATMPRDEVDIRWIWDLSPRDRTALFNFFEELRVYRDAQEKEVNAGMGMDRAENPAYKFFDSRVEGKEGAWLVGLKKQADLIWESCSDKSEATVRLLALAEFVPAVKNVRSYSESWRTTLNGFYRASDAAWQYASEYGRLRLLPVAAEASAHQIDPTMEWTLSLYAKRTIFLGLKVNVPERASTAAGTDIDYIELANKFLIPPGFAFPEGEKNEAQNLKDYDLLFSAEARAELKSQARVMGFAVFEYLKNAYETNFNGEIPELRIKEIDQYLEKINVRTRIHPDSSAHIEVSNEGEIDTEALRQGFNETFIVLKKIQAELASSGHLGLNTKAREIFLHPQYGKDARHMLADAVGKLAPAVLRRLNKKGLIELLGNSPLISGKPELIKLTYLGNSKETYNAGLGLALLRLIAVHFKYEPTLSSENNKTTFGLKTGANTLLRVDPASRSRAKTAFDDVKEMNDLEKWVEPDARKDTPGAHMALLPAFFGMNESFAAAPPASISEMWGQIIVAVLMFVVYFAWRAAGIQVKSSETLPTYLVLTRALAMKRLTASGEIVFEAILKALRNSTQELSAREIIFFKVVSMLDQSLPDISAKEFLQLEKLISAARSSDPFLYLIDVPSLLVLALSPYMNTDTYLAFCGRLDDVPPPYKSDVVAMNLILTGIHLRNNFVDSDFADVLAILPQLRWAREKVRQLEDGSEEKAKLFRAIGFFMLGFSNTESIDWSEENNLNLDWEGARQTFMKEISHLEGDQRQFAPDIFKAVKLVEEETELEGDTALARHSWMFTIKMLIDARYPGEPGMTLRDILLGPKENRVSFFLKNGNYQPPLKNHSKEETGNDFKWILNMIDPKPKATMRDLRAANGQA